ncbi:MAG: S8 family serine peptidase [Thermodesulfobacteriota bacterium]
MALLGLLLSASPVAAGTASDRKAAPAVIAGLTAGQPQEVLVLLDLPLRRRKALDAAGEEERQVWLARLQEETIASLAGELHESLVHYRHLPLLALRLHRLAALERLCARPSVRQVFPNERRHRLLTQSLPLVGQPWAAAGGYLGAGTTVAVLDSGIDYRLPAFGSCLAPGVGDGCRVVYARDFAPDDGMPDDGERHGTNVGGVIAAVAPAASLISLDIFGRFGGEDADILAAIDWTVGHQAQLGVRVLNLSLGSGVFPAPCGDSPYEAAFAEARAAGIVPVVAAGNEALRFGLAEPACAPSAVSVGAVYDDNLGPVRFFDCRDPVTAADRVTCYSNTAPYLTLLAPGDEIRAAGVTEGGTSQAAPHVAGALAVLAAAFPGEGPDALVARLVVAGVPVRDRRTGLVKPRLALAAALSQPAPASAELAPFFAASQRRCWGGHCQVEGELVIRNTGTVASPAAGVLILLSQNLLPDRGDTPVAWLELPVIPEGGEVRLPFGRRLASGRGPAGSRLIALVDPLGQVAELDDQNNLVVSATLR